MASDSSDKMLPRRSNRLRLLKEPLSPLVNLHPEIWRLILQKLAQEDALNLRLVNNDFKMKVDNLYEDWIISLDDSCPYLDMILNLRVKEVIVERLLNPMTNRPPGTIFGHPNLLKTIDVQEYYENGISDENLHILLSKSKMVESISIQLKDSISHDVFWTTLDPHIGYDLPELRTLNIQLWHDLNQSVTIDNFWGRLMTRSRMPNLKVLNVAFGNHFQGRVSTHMKTVFLFLSRHGQTLKHFTLHDWVGEKVGLNPLSSEEERSLLQNCRTLETLCFDPDGSQSDELNDILRRFVLAQSKLVYLKLGKVSNTTCAKICAKNFQTLTSVSITDLIVDGERAEGEKGRFDISFFGKCVNLKYLWLSPKLGESTELCNLFKLSEKIEKLSLHRFFISTEDISKFFKNHTSLLWFSIRLTKNCGQYGINVFVLEEILKHKSLTSVRIRRNSIITPKTAAELGKMNEIFSDLGCQKIGNKFDFTTLLIDKRTDSNGISKWVSLY